MGSLVSRVTRSTATRSAVNIKRPPLPEKNGANEVGMSDHQPNPELLGRLKEVYVNSTTDVVTQENPYASERSNPKLPQDRSDSHSDSNMSTASEGYLTNRQVVEIFNLKNKDKEEWTASKVSSVFKISPSDAENLLKYFETYKTVATVKDNKPEMKFHHLHE